MQFRVEEEDSNEQWTKNNQGMTSTENLNDVTRSWHLSILEGLNFKGFA